MIMKLRVCSIWFLVTGVLQKWVYFIFFRNIIRSYSILSCWTSVVWLCHAEDFGCLGLTVIDKRALDCVPLQIKISFWLITCISLLTVLQWADWNPGQVPEQVQWHRVCTEDRKRWTLKVSLFCVSNFRGFFFWKVTCGNFGVNWAVWDSSFLSFLLDIYRQLASCMTWE